MNVPGDRAISQRFALLASLAEGPSKITNYGSSAEAAAFLDRLEALGVNIGREGGVVTIQGLGLDGIPRSEFGALVGSLACGGADESAKTRALFDALFTEGPTVFQEPAMLRDHTEIAMRAFGADVRSLRRMITVEGRPNLEGREVVVPNDLALTAAFLVAGLVVPGSNLVIQNVGLNPTRATLLDFLLSAGARIRVARIESVNGEMIGDLEVRHTPVVRCGPIDGATAAELSEELPVLAVLGALSEGGFAVRRAPGLQSELLADGLARLEVTPDGIRVPGRQSFRGAALDSHGDWRLGMAFAVAALRADGPSTLAGADTVEQVFPGFWSVLERLAA